MAHGGGAFALFSAVAAGVATALGAGVAAALSGRPTSTVSMDGAPTASMARDGRFVVGPQAAA